MEHPADPGSEPYASIWVTAEVMEMEKRLGALRRHIDQCQLGCEARKPTFLSGNATELRGPPILCQGGHRHLQAYGRCPTGGYRSKRFQSYRTCFAYGSPAL